MNEGDVTLLASRGVVSDGRLILPVISMWMPWANWVALGWKTTETRTHRRLLGLVSRRIAIHASQKWDDGAIDAARAYLTEEQISATERFLRIGGAIIATAHVSVFRPLTAEDSQASLINCGNIQRYGLLLSGVQPIEAIPMRGRQGIWYHDFGADVQS